MMRILPFLFLLPVLVVSASCTQVVPYAIANNDSPFSPQPAIAPSAVTEKLTIESLAGTYKGVVNEQELTNYLREWKTAYSFVVDEVSSKMFETYIRRVIDQMKITINADGTFKSEFTLENSRGNVKLDGSKLSFTAAPTGHTGGETKVHTFLLVVSADRKSLLMDSPTGSFKILRAYVKQ